MSVSETIAILIKADGQAAIRELNKVGDAAKREMGKADRATRDWSATFTRTGTQMVGAAAVGAVGLYKLGNAASDLGESVNKANVIFGESATSVERFADSAKDIGLSKRAALDAAAGFGTLFVGIGKTERESAGFSTTLAGLAADLASFNNTSVDDAVLALGAGLRGEAEPLRRFGVLLDEATLKQKALDLGLIDSATGTLPQAVKVQAAYASILEQTTRQQGDFARTSDSLANQQRKLTAEWENLQAALGQGVLPFLTKVTGGLTSTVEAMNGLPGPVKETAGGLATVAVGAAAVTGALLIMAGQARRARDALTTVGDDGARSLNKVGKAAAGLAALGAAVELGTVLRDIFVGTEQSTSGLEGDIKKIATTLYNAADSAGQTKDAISGLDREFAAFVTAGPAIENLGLAGLQQQLDDGRVSAQDLNEALTGTTAEFERFVRATNSSDAQIAGLTEWRGELERAAQDTIAAQRAAGDYTQAQTDLALASTKNADGTNNYQQALALLVSDVKEAKRATDDFRESQDRLFDAVTGRREELLGIRDAQRGITQAQIDAAQAADDLTKAQADYDAAIKEFGRNSPEARDAQRDLQRAFLEVQATADGAEQAVYDYAKQLGGTEADAGPKKIQNTIDKLEKVRDTVAPGSPLRKALDTYIRDLKERIPDRVQTKIDAEYNVRLIEVRREQTGTFNNARDVGRAIGGPVSPYRSYTVGERGPETFRPSVPGVILPSGTNTGKDGGYTMNVTVNVHGDVLDSVDFERKVTTAIANATRRGTL